jgi:hypothetical protein
MEETAIRSAGAGLGEPADPDALVKLAEEGEKAAPSWSSRTTLIAALSFRAHQALQKQDESYKKLADKTRRSLGPALLTFVLAREGSLRNLALANEDVKRAMELHKEQVKRFPRSASPSTWAFLVAACPDEAKQVAANCLGNKRVEVKKKIDRALSPLGSSVVMDEYYLLLLAGRTTDAESVLARAEKLGVPMPLAK